jgi:hypothetical protein
VTSSTEKNAFQPWWNGVEVTLFGAAAAPKEVRIGDAVIHEWRYDGLVHAITLTVPDATKNWSIRLAF